jgi:hypothetical protein
LEQPQKHATTQPHPDQKQKKNAKITNKQIRQLLAAFLEQLQQEPSNQSLYF